jgi:hypothetical protein
MMASFLDVCVMSSGQASLLIMQQIGEGKLYGTAVPSVVYVAGGQHVPI